MIYKHKIFLDDKLLPYDIFTRNLDPIYERNEDWTLIKSYDEFVEFINLNHNNVTTISFDHDLLQEHYLNKNQNSEINYNLIEKTGWHCLKFYLENYFNKKTKLLLHSLNAEGKKNMKNLLEKNLESE